MISRSEFIKLTSLLCFEALRPTNMQAYNDSGSNIYLSAGFKEGKHYSLCGISSSGRELYSIDLPTRGHAIAINQKTNECAIIARSPGNYVYIFDVKSGSITNKIICNSDFHYYGHGFYSCDGRWLYTSENEYESGKGFLGIYDSHHSYQLVKRIYTNGIGPHEIVLLKDGKTVAIANGGILTHPDTGNTKLNLQDMVSKLTYVNLETGNLVAENELLPEYKFMSIRHLDVSSENKVALAMQYQGSGNKPNPLVGLSDINNGIKFFDTPIEVIYRMQNYCGSICFDSSGNFLAVSNPRGGMITFWKVQNRSFYSLMEIKDGCGVSQSDEPNTFCISNGYGDLFKYWPIEHKKEKLKNNVKMTGWDNHLKLYLYF